MTTPITYPKGAWLVDTHHDKVGQLMDNADGLLHLRPVGGGKEWLVKPEAVRPANLSERQQAGITLEQEAERQMTQRDFRAGPVAVVPENGGPSC